MKNALSLVAQARRTGTSIAGVILILEAGLIIPKMIR